MPTGPRSIAWRLIIFVVVALPLALVLELAAVAIDSDWFKRPWPHWGPSHALGLLGYLLFLAAPLAAVVAVVLFVRGRSRT
jgi:hypothetical protein